MESSRSECSSAVRRPSAMALLITAAAASRSASEARRLEFELKPWASIQLLSAIPASQRNSQEQTGDQMGHVEAAHVSHTLPDGRVLLDDVSFRVGEGVAAALIGPNGAGKSTILRLLAGDL